MGLGLEAGQFSKGMGCFEPHFFRNLPRPNRLPELNEFLTKRCK